MKNEARTREIEFELPPVAFKRLHIEAGCRNVSTEDIINELILRLPAAQEGQSEDDGSEAPESHLIGAVINDLIMTYLPAVEGE